MEPPADVGAGKSGRRLGDGVRARIALVGLVLAVFWPLTRAEFIDYDDQIHVFHNRLVKEISRENLVRLWRKPYQGLYIPVTYTLWMFQVRIARGETLHELGTRISPHVFHTTNLALHCLSALLALGILRRLTGGLWPAFGGALLWALHPVQVESVAWVSELKGLLAGLFALAALRLYIAYAECGRGPGAGPGPSGRASGGWAAVLRAVGLYAAGLAAFGVGLLSKPSAIVVPLMGGLIAVFMLRRRVWKTALEMALWLGAAAPVMKVAMGAQPEEIAGFHTPALLRPIVACDTLAFYLGKLVWPSPLCILYSRTPQEILIGNTVWLTAAVPVVLGAALLIRARRGWALASAGLFVAGLSPVLGLVYFAHQEISTVADRYLYLPMLGPALALASVLARWPRRWVAGAAAVWIAALGAVSIVNVGYWHNSETLFTHAVAAQPRSWRAWGLLGGMYEQKGDFENAYASDLTSWKLQPGSGQTNGTLANLLARNGRYREAMRFYATALRLMPNDAELHNNVGFVLARQGKTFAAMYHYRQAIQLKPESATPKRNLAWLLATADDPKLRNGREALALAIAAVQQTRGETPEELDTLAAAAAEVGSFDRAVGAATAAAALARKAGRLEYAAEIERRLAAYRQGHPWHEKPE